MIRKRNNYGKKEEQDSAKAQNRLNHAAAPGNEDREFVLAGSVIRTKTLLLAALRVWELKQQLREN